ncbi:hypothetical protein SCHPADRAFT_816395 [Schizopora paradoxa]|uniref:Uncharacterized protein n=1 Tax=Schizopora paradoxa TaxID=27342 RepID=A0A0H2S9Y7_9AGAM|nr:hypothetical protein SCHPADRAFT_816395 [Schizopora paradoxa]
MVQCLPLIAIPRRSRSLILVVLIALIVTIFHFTGDISTSTRHEDAALELLEPDNGEILLVSAYFPESRSRLAYENSVKRFSRFLGQVSTDIYFYTSPDFVPTIQFLRGHLPISINTTFESPFDISVLGSRRGDYLSMANNTSGADENPPDTIIASAHAFSNAKPYLLAEAIRTTQALYTKSYKYAFWIDADSFDADHGFKHWPSLGRLDEVWTDGRRESGARLEDMVFIPMWDLPKVDFLLWKEERGPIGEDFSQESLFGGMSKSILWLERYYYAYLNHYLNEGFLSAGKGEALMNSLLLLHPENFITVWHGDPAAPSAVYNPANSFRNDSELILGDCGNPRHYYQFFLASSAERDANREIWDSAWNWKFWELEKWTRIRESCRLTKILAIQWTLRRRFGEMWRSPAQSVAF